MRGLFDLPPSRSNRDKDTQLSKKANRTAAKIAKTAVKGGGGLLERINTIVAMVKQHLGRYENDYLCIRDEKTFIEYIDNIIEVGVCSVDTETTGLNPISDELAGVCLYSSNQKPAYIPINHISYITQLKVAEQLDIDIVKEQFKRLIDNNVKFIFHNAVFDMRFIKNQLGIEVIPNWDTYVAARLLNENEPDNRLKPLHKKYCMVKDDEVFNFSDLFKGIPFTLIPLSVAYLYASGDAIKTFELYEFQRPFLTPNDKECIDRGLVDVANLYHNIEIPLFPVIAKMEDTGIAFDFDYAEKLSIKYNEKLKETEQKFFNLCDTYSEEIEAYRKKTGFNCKLGKPINIASPAQISILLYDILGIKPPDKSNPNGTGEEILEQIKHPISEVILEYRGVSKLLSTYIDKMPKEVNEKTGRIHAKFNQVGADTGRFSSSDPNMQNIPSHNTDIRKMFVATDGYYLLSSDYSAQEPRLTAHMSNDKKMIDAYNAGKDLYVEIASIAFNLPYDECKEFRADGTKNPDGKERRGQAKAIVLGVCYGKGIPAIAKDLNISVKKAQEIYDKIMTSFPALRQFMIDSENMAREKGFVTTVWGRKRRLPNMQLPPYEYSYSNEGVGFDPLDFDEHSEEVPESVIKKYNTLLSAATRWKDKENIKRLAELEGIHIKDNGGYIAEATRQCVNSRIQGSAADQTKKAMILVDSNKRLRELGFRLLLPIHDELIGECPIENVKEVAKLYSELMVEAAKDLVVPSKCDVEVSREWYGESVDIGL